MDTLYVVVNGELGMSPGKIASQVGHAIVEIVDECMRDGYEGAGTLYMQYIKWKNGDDRIVVLECPNETLLRDFHGKDKTMSRLFVDSGRTTENTCDKITALAYFPVSSEKVSYLKSLPTL